MFKKFNSVMKYIINVTQTVCKSKCDLLVPTFVDQLHQQPRGVTGWRFLFQSHIGPNIHFSKWSPSAFTKASSPSLMAFQTLMMKLVDMVAHSFLRNAFRASALVWGDAQALLST